MSGGNFIVPPKSWEIVRGHADKMRATFGLEDAEIFPAIELLEQVLDHHELVSLDIFPEEEMENAEGETSPNGDFIRIRQDVYEAACNGDARARFTIAHELGHWDMHTNVPLARAKQGTKIPGYMDSEAQANQFAAELLMPIKFFQANDTVMTVMMRHGVSAQAAQIRLKYLKKEGFL